MLSANLVILAQTCEEWSCRQATLCRIFSRNGQNDLEGQGRWLLFSIPTKSIPGCMFSTNLVVLAQICDELVCGQSQISLNSESKWPKRPWRPRSMTSILYTKKGIPGCMFGANLVILAQICDELSGGQAKFPWILGQNGQNDLEGQGQWPPFSIPAESISRCMFGANLVIIVQTG